MLAPLPTSTSFPNRASSPKVCLIWLHLQPTESCQTPGISRCFRKSPIVAKMCPWRHLRNHRKQQARTPGDQRAHKADMLPSHLRGASNSWANGELVSRREASEARKPQVNSCFIHFQFSCSGSELPSSPVPSLPSPGARQDGPLAFRASSGLSAHSSGYSPRGCPCWRLPARMGHPRPGGARLGPGSG